MRDGASVGHFVFVAHFRGGVEEEIDIFPTLWLVVIVEMMMMQGRYLTEFCIPLTYDIVRM